MSEVLLSVFILLFDQLFKQWSVAQYARQGSTVLIPGIMGLSYVQNPGASWGILAGKTDFLLLLTTLICGAIFVALLLHRPVAPLGRLSLSMVLGGALGNALDRLVDGYVTDMFETLFIHFPVFNIADCFITVGGALFCLYVLLSERQLRGKEPGDDITAG